MNLFPLNQLPAPILDPDDLNSEFWKSLRNKELRLVKCVNCNHYVFPKTVSCTHCGESSWQWTKVPAEGIIYSWSRTWHPPHSSLKSYCPYLTVEVTILCAPEVHLYGGFISAISDDESPIIGAKVQGVFETNHSTYNNVKYGLLQWKYI